MNSEIRSHLFSLSPNAFQICKGPRRKSALKLCIISTSFICVNASPSGEGIKDSQARIPGTRYLPGPFLFE